MIKGVNTRGQQHPVRAARRHTLAEASYFRWDWRACRCLLAQDEQRVCTRMAGCCQSLQRPDFFILRRCSAESARARSCRSSGVRRTRFGFWDAFGFEVVAAGFDSLRAGVRVAFGLAAFLVLGLSYGSGR
jgi:hypothetical protein